MKNKIDCNSPHCTGLLLNILLVNAAGDPFWLLHRVFGVWVVSWAHLWGWVLHHSLWMQRQAFHPQNSHDFASETLHCQRPQPSPPIQCNYRICFYLQSSQWQSHQQTGSCHHHHHSGHLLNYHSQWCHLAKCLCHFLLSSVFWPFESFSSLFQSFIFSLSLCAFSSSSFSGVSVKIFVFTLFLFILGVVAVALGKGSMSWGHIPKMGRRTSSITYVQLVRIHDSVSWFRQSSRWLLCWWAIRTHGMGWWYRQVSTVGWLLWVWPVCDHGDGA